MTAVLTEGMIGAPARSLPRSMLAVVLLSTAVLVGCAIQKSPQFSYDDHVPPLPSSPPAAVADPAPKPLHVPPGWTPARGGNAAETPAGRVASANLAARGEPRREGYYNAIQVYPWSEGALYQVYAAPGQITDIALEFGETLSGEGSIAAGDTACWIIGDTQSGSGTSRRVHVFVKPTREDISTNLVITTDRRRYMLELRADEETWMPAVSWPYPASSAAVQRRVAFSQPVPMLRRANRHADTPMTAMSPFG